MIKVELSNLFQSYDMLSDVAPLKTILQLLPLLEEADVYLKRKVQDRKEFILSGVKIGIKRRYQELLKKAIPKEESENSAGTLLSPGQLLHFCDLLMLEMANIQFFDQFFKRFPSPLFFSPLLSSSLSPLFLSSSLPLLSVIRHSSQQNKPNLRSFFEIGKICCTEYAHILNTDLEKFCNEIGDRFSAASVLKLSLKLKETIEFFSTKFPSYGFSLSDLPPLFSRYIKSWFDQTSRQLSKWTLQACQNEQVGSKTSL